MKIALIGELSKPININSSAGTETWNYNFAEQLVERGHEVSLFACEGSRSSSKVISICKVSDIYSKTLKDFSRKKLSLYTIDEILHVLKEQDNYDLIHSSICSFYHFLPMSNFFKKPTIVTIHSYEKFDHNDTKIIFKRFDKPHYVFPSSSFLKNWSKPKKYRVIHHGINLDQFEFSIKAKDYFLWIGGICEGKGTKDAIDFAKQKKCKLYIAGTKSDPLFFDQVVKPNLSKNIRYIGVLGLKEKNRYYQGAKAVLFTSKIKEAFGLVMVESLACGTPVIAYNQGPVPEIIKNGTNGFCVKTGDIKGLVQASENIEKIQRENCRKYVEEKFSIERMVNEYEDYYKEIIESN